jgi:hypothetical protein
MTNDEILYWERVRAICCQAWGKAPWEWDEARRDGRINTSHVQRTVDLFIVTSPNPQLVEEYLQPGTLAARKEQEEQERIAKSWNNLEHFVSMAPVS